MSLPWQKWYAKPRHTGGAFGYRNSKRHHDSL
jgi:hypothetical protein